jgi:hypothetical protein
MTIKRVPLAPPATEINAKLKALSTASVTLNDLSDQLTREVASIESTINQLNLGISASVTFETWSDDTGMISDLWRLAYGRSSNKWGFLVEHLNENLNYPEEGDLEAWPFKDAPREQRLKAVGKIPELLDLLVKKSSEFASDVTSTVGYVKALAVGFEQSKPESSRK